MANPLAPNGFLKITENELKNQYNNSRVIIYNYYKLYFIHMREPFKHPLPLTHWSNVLIYLSKPLTNSKTSFVVIDSWRCKKREARAMRVVTYINIYFFLFHRFKCTYHKTYYTTIGIILLYTLPDRIDFVLFLFLWIIIPSQDYHRCAVVDEGDTVPAEVFSLRSFGSIRGRRCSNGGEFVVVVVVVYHRGWENSIMTYDDDNDEKVLVQQQSCSPRWRVQKAGKTQTT